MRKLSPLIVCMMAAIALFTGWLGLFLTNGYAPGWYGSLFAVCPLLLRTNWEKTKSAESVHPKIVRGLVFANSFFGLCVVNADFSWLAAAVFIAGFAATYWLVTRPLFERGA